MFQYSVVTGVARAGRKWKKQELMASSGERLLKLSPGTPRNIRRYIKGAGGLTGEMWLEPEKPHNLNITYEDTLSKNLFYLK